MERQNSITISLIIPVYNVSKYIDRCLKSIIKQTYNQFECILVDDASPDDSISKCEQLIAAYKGPIHFRILRHSRNRGLSAARNTGIDAATSDYLLFIDSDDLISDDCVEKLMAPVRKDPGIEMVVGEHLRFSNDGLFDHGKNNWRHEAELTTHKAVRHAYFDRQHYLPPAAWNKLIRRDFIEQNHLRFQEGLIWEDSLWTFLEMKYLSHLYIIPDITYFYYIRPDSISSGTNQEELSFHGCLVSDLISSNFTLGDETREAKYCIENFCYYYAKTPRRKEFRKTAKRFARALPFRKYPKQRILLAAASILPRNDRGKAIYNWISKKYT